MYKQGLIRSIGVSNFKTDHLESLMQYSTVTPAVNQMEYHPLNTQKNVFDFCKSKGIQYEAYSPLIRGNLDIPLLNRIGQKYGKSSAQVILRWDIQNGVVTIPKSIHEDRIKENADIFDFELSAEDMGLIDGLDGHR